MDVGVGLWCMRSTAYVPASPATLYRELVDDALLAQELGLHSLWLSEHHGWYDGWCPSLLVAAGAVLGATADLHVGTGVFLLPLHDPARVAAAGHALHDLAPGRTELGIGLGYRDAEFDAIGISRTHRGRRADAALDLLIGEWADGGPRIWVGGISDHAVNRAADRGLSLFLPSSMGPDRLREVIERAREATAARGTTIERIGVIKDAWITDGTAVRERSARAGIGHHVREYGGAWWLLEGPPRVRRPRAAGPPSAAQRGCGLGRPARGDRGRPAGARGARRRPRRAPGRQRLHPRRPPPEHDAHRHRSRSRARMRLGLVLAPPWWAPLARLAELFGFEVVWIDERATPAPLVVAASLADRIDSARVVASVNAGPHPVTLAEEAAVADLALGGRLILGLHGDDEALLSETVDLLHHAFAARPFRHDGARWTVPARLPEHELAPSVARVTPAPAQLELPIWLSGGAAPAVARAHGLTWVAGAGERLDGDPPARLRRPAMRSVPIGDDGLVDVSALVEALTRERDESGLDVAILELAGDIDDRQKQIVQIGREVRPRLQLAELPVGLEATWWPRLARTPDVG